MRRTLFLGGVLGMIGVFTLWVFWPQRTIENTTSATPAQVLAPEVEMILQQKIALLAKTLQNPFIIDAIKKANEEHKGIPLETILGLDARWRSAPETDGFIQAFLTNEVAQELKKFQAAHAGFSEIFVTDAHGLNVGQTNKTTDYYQADEEWWTDSYDGARGRPLHGSIEFDESAQTEAIALYVPVTDTMSGRAIGVAKAVISLPAIKQEL